MNNEQSVEKYLCRKIKEHGGICVKLTGYNGIPDRLIIMPNGKCYFVELKAEGGKLSPVQIAVHYKMQMLGHEVYVLWNHAEVNNWIKQHA